MVADKVSKVVAKPQLRGLLRNQIKINLIGAFVTSIGAGLALKLFVNDSRKRRYADFYKSYDIEKDFQEQKAKGLFDSC